MTEYTLKVKEFSQGNYTNFLLVKKDGDVIEKIYFNDSPKSTYPSKAYALETAVNHIMGEYERP